MPIEYSDHEREMIEERLCAIEEQIKLTRENIENRLIFKQRRFTTPIEYSAHELEMIEERLCDIEDQIKLTRENIENHPSIAYLSVEQVVWKTLNLLKFLPKTDEMKQVMEQRR